MIERRAPAWRGACASLFFALVAPAAATGVASAADAPSPLAQLPALRIDPARVTVSGISSGGAMAVQFHVAHSSLVHGVGAFAAPPYWCAEGSIATALGRCMKGGEIPVDALLAAADRFAAGKQVDPVAGLKADRVWLYRGAADPHVAKDVADALERFYRARVDGANVARVELAGGAHNFPTSQADAPACGTSEPPYLANCGFDGAAKLFAHLYGTPGAATGAKAGTLREFAQEPYAEPTGSRSFADRGWLYVPEACGKGQACGLHVVFHGCKQGATQVGDAFVRGAGYLAGADAHRVVLLFPQVEPTVLPLNPMGCWDWWGYDGDDYATRDGKQVRAVAAMVQALMKPAGKKP